MPLLVPPSPEQRKRIAADTAVYENAAKRARGGTSPTPAATPRAPPATTIAGRLPSPPIPMPMPTPPPLPVYNPGYKAFHTAICTNQSGIVCGKRARDDDGDLGLSRLGLGQHPPGFSLDSCKQDDPSPVSKRARLVVSRVPDCGPTLTTPSLPPPTPPQFTPSAPPVENSSTPMALIPYSRLNFDAPPPEPEEDPAAWIVHAPIPGLNVYRDSNAALPNPSAFDMSEAGCGMQLVLFRPNEFDRFQSIDDGDGKDGTGQAGDCMAEDGATGLNLLYLCKFVFVLATLSNEGLKEKKVRNAPQASRMSGDSGSDGTVACKYLDELNACGPSFAGWPIVVDKTGATGFASETVFNNFVANLAAPGSDMTLLLSIFGGSCGLQLASNASTAAALLRYQASYVCANSVFEAVKFMRCPSASGPASRDNTFGNVTLVPNLCVQAVASYSAASEGCAGSSAAAANMLNTCNFMSANLAESTASSLVMDHAPRAWLGLQSENQQCGFTRMDSFTRYCSSNSNSSDPCCSVYNTSVTFASWDNNTRQFSLSPETSFPRMNTTSGNIPWLPNGGKETLSAAIIGAITAGAVILVGVAAACARLFCIRRRRTVEPDEASVVGSAHVGKGLGKQEDVEAIASVQAPTPAAGVHAATDKGKSQLQQHHRPPHNADVDRVDESLGNTRLSILKADIQIRSMDEKVRPVDSKSQVTANVAGVMYYRKRKDINDLSNEKDDEKKDSGQGSSHQAGSAGDAAAMAFLRETADIMSGTGTLPAYGAHTTPSSNQSPTDFSPLSSASVLSPRSPIRK
ncbi:hypothetical protein BC830DRAFT_1163181 [Chytriomyces sp. MP71]|nr:hypothetical protein BC830DRAFT_1163181 [Chytriomyces sp. MP71]